MWADPRVDDRDVCVHPVVDAVDGRLAARDAGVSGTVMRSRPVGMVCAAACTVMSGSTAATFESLRSSATLLGVRRALKPERAWL